MTVVLYRGNVVPGLFRSPNLYLFVYFIVPVQEPPPPFPIQREESVPKPVPAARSSRPSIKPVIDKSHVDHIWRTFIDWLAFVS
jgi:hypothetical protein